MRNYNSENVYILGDTHSLNIVGLLTRYDIRHCIIVHVGDAGEGFAGNEDQKHLIKLNKFLNERNSYLLITRGNHANVEFYSPNHWTDKFSTIQFVQDYDVLSINGKSVLFVGGAISVDRKLRTAGIDYWTDEKFKLEKEWLKYCEKDYIDVLITHTSHIHNGYSRISHFFDNDPTLEKELNEEKKLVKSLVDTVNPKLAHFWGHFHYPHLSYEKNGRQNRCLSIEEIYDATRLFQ